MLGALLQLLRSMVGKKGPRADAASWDVDPLHLLKRRERPEIVRRRR
jgi:hypothetical protein